MVSNSSWSPGACEGPSAGTCPSGKLGAPWAPGHHASGPCAEPCSSSSPTCRRKGILAVASSHLFPIQPKVYAEGVYSYFRSQVLHSQLPVCRGSCWAVADAPSTQCYLAEHQLPLARPSPPPPHSSGLCNNSPSQWSFPQAVCPLQCSATGAGRNPWEGGRHPHRRNGSHAPSVVVLVTLVAL